LEEIEGRETDDEEKKNVVPHLAARVEIEELGNHKVRHIVVHWASEPDNALGEELRDNLRKPLDD